MPDIQSELKKVIAEKPALQKPLRERLWLWLLTHPDKTARHIADSLREPADCVSRTLYDLKCRGMVTQIKHGSDAFRWSVVKPKSSTFELLPKILFPKSRVKTLKPSKVPQLKNPVVTAAESNCPTTFSVYHLPEQSLNISKAVVKKAQPQPTADERAQALVETLTLDTAYATYHKLKAYFEPKVL